MNRAQSLFLVVVAFALGSGAFLIAPAAFGDNATGSANKVVGWQMADAAEWETVEQKNVEPTISVSELLRATDKPLASVR